LGGKNLRIASKLALFLLACFAKNAAWVVLE
jgi:hypothetical protein